MTPPPPRRTPAATPPLDASDLRSIWRQTTWRHWTSRWKETLTLLLIISLGLAVFLSVRLANRASVASFGTFVGAVSGSADWVVTSPSSVIPVTWLPEMRDALTGQSAQLVPVRESIAAEAENGKLIDIIGIDLVAALNLPFTRESEETSGPLAVEGESFTPRDFLGESIGYPSVALAQALGEETETVRLVFAGEPIDVTIGNILPPSEEGLGMSERFLLVDLATLLRWEGGEQTVDRVEVVVADGVNLDERRDTVAATLRERSDGRWDVVTPETERSTGEKMTSAFRLNLTILSLIALVVGLYLVLQALEAAVVRRRKEIATLRALGLSRGALRILWLGDALVLGALGTLGGVFLGWLGGQVAVGLVGTTVQTIYGGSGATAPSLTAFDIVLTLALGLVATLGAGWLPAEEASRIAPSEVLRSGQVGTGLSVLQKPWRGLPIVIVGMALTFLPAVVLPSGSPFPLAAYGTAFLWMLGGTLLAVLAIPVVGFLIRFSGGGIAPLRVAAQRLRHASGRHKLTVAGLFIASGMAGAILIMVSSFQATMLHWIGETLQGDLYMSPRGAINANDFRMIPEEVWKDLASDASVAKAYPVQVRRVMFRDQPILVAGSSLTDPSRNYIWVTPPPSGVNLVSGATTVEPAFVSESFARRFGTNLEEALTVQTPNGPQTVIVQGVYAEYGNEFGTIIVEREALARWYGTDGAMRMTITLREGFTPDSVQQRWQAAYPGLDVRTNGALRTEVLRLFRQTFSVTYALQLIGLAVAMAGLGLGLVALAYETRAETKTLRAVGFSRGQLTLTTLTEGTGLALAGVLSGLGLAASLGWLLVNVVNKQAFGWTLSFQMPWLGLALIGVVVVGTGAVVSGMIGSRSARTALEREE